MLMKNLFTCFLALLPLLFFQCKKEPPHLNMTLYNKPLPGIKAHIKGTWKLHYGKGGFIANMKQYYENTYYEFGDNDRVKITSNGNVHTDSTIGWTRELGTYTNGDSTFTMKFYDKQNVPWVYVVEQIVNDTLILHDNSSDAVFYHFTKL